MYSRQFLAGFLIAGSLVALAIYVGSWFGVAVTFADSRSLDAARDVKPLICSFNHRTGSETVRGSIRIRDGLMHFDITDGEKGSTVSWGAELDTHDGRMASQATTEDPYVSIDDYPALRQKIYGLMESYLKSLHIACVPWWFSARYEFALEQDI